MEQAKSNKKINLGELRKEIPLKFYNMKISSIKTPSLPPDLERALKEAIKGNGFAFQDYKRRTIGEIVVNSFIVDSVGKEILETLGLSQNDFFRIRDEVDRLTRRVDAVNWSDFPKVVGNLSELFREVLGDLKVEDRNLVIFSLGCGIAPEATAFSQIYEEINFNGFDKNPQIIDRARRMNKVPGVNFSVFDLTAGLPSGEPDLVIIRNPTIFIWEKEGQNLINPVWQDVFGKLRQSYPQAGLLATFITQEEANQAASWMNVPSEPKQNRFATPLEAQILKYGIFDLPVRVDKYYLFSYGSRVG